MDRDYMMWGTKLETKEMDPTNEDQHWRRKDIAHCVPEKLCNDWVMTAGGVQMLGLQTEFQNFVVESHFLDI